MRRTSLSAILLLACFLPGAARSQSSELASWGSARGILIEGATVVTMDEEHTVLPHGPVLVRDGRIVAVWQAPTPPDGVTVGDASVVRAGPQDLLFPGLYLANLNHVGPLGNPFAGTELGVLAAQSHG
jgi:hypothetical protein